MSAGRISGRALPPVVGDFALPAGEAGRATPAVDSTHGLLGAIMPLVFV